MIHLVPSKASKRDGTIEEYAPSISIETARQCLSDVGHTLFEALEDGMITKMFFDHDERVEGEITQERIDSSMAEAQDRVRGLFGNQYDMYRYLYATRHGYYPEWGQNKISIRVFVLGLRVNYTEIKHMITSAGQDSYWDTNPYNKRQLLACVNGMKDEGDPRILTPMSGDTDPADYLVQVTDPEWPLVGYTKPDVRSEATRQAAKEGDTNFQPDAKFVEDILLLIGPGRYTEPYESWRDIGFGASEGASRLDPDDKQGINTRLLKAFKAASRRVPKYDNYKAQIACDTVWKNANGDITFRTCMFLAKQDDPESYAKALHAYNIRQALIQASENDVARREIHGLLVGRFPDTYGDLASDYKIYVADRKRKALSRLPKDTVIFSGDSPGTPGLAGLITQDLDVFSLPPDLSAVTMDTYLGLLSEDISGDTLMNHVHKVIPGDVKQYRYNRPEKDYATLVSKEPAGKVAIKMYLKDEQCYLADIAVEGQKTIQLENEGVGKKRLEKLFQSVDAMIRQHVKERFGGEQLTAVLVGKNYGTVNVNVNINTADETEKNDFEQIRDTLLEYAAPRNHHKRNGEIFEPVPNCPCGFQVVAEYAPYITGVLLHDKVFHSNPKYHGMLTDYLQKYQIPRLPDLVVDRHLLSFRNGVLNLATTVFTPYPSSNLEGCMARHHIDADYTGSEETPTLDIILDAQFDRDVSEVMCALAGRVYFQVGELDKWEVLLFLVGLGGCGKSKILDCIKAGFAISTVATLASKREEVFGIQNLADKELIVGQDMPQKLSSVLPQEMVQSMTTGEGVEVARKTKGALNIPNWKVPIVMASNCMPDYVNIGNNIGRRLVTIRFDNPIVRPRESLGDELKAELPNIICRFIHAYARMRARVQEAGSFWQAVPAVMLAWQDRLCSATNTLHAFLTKEDDARGCKIECVEGHITWVTDFKKAFQAAMQCTAPDSLDIAVLRKFGFTLSPSTINCCNHCKQFARGGKDKCCPAYNNNQRSRKAVIYNMRLQRDADGF